RRSLRRAGARVGTARRDRHLPPERSLSPCARLPESRRRPDRSDAVPSRGEAGGSAAERHPQAANGTRIGVVGSIAPRHLLAPFSSRTHPRIPPTGENRASKARDEHHSPVHSYATPNPSDQWTP